MVSCKSSRTHGTRWLERAIAAAPDPADAIRAQALLALGAVRCRSPAPSGQSVRRLWETPAISSPWCRSRSPVVWGLTPGQCPTGSPESTPWLPTSVRIMLS